MPEEEEVDNFNNGDSKITIKDWIDIIDRDIQNKNTIALYIVTKIGSSLVLLAIMLWFLFTNYISVNENINVDKTISFTIFNLVFFYCLYILIIGIITYRSNKKRLDSDLPILKRDQKNINLNIIIMLIIVEIFILGIILYEWHNTVDPSFYYVLGVILGIIIGLIIWIIHLISKAVTPYEDLLLNLRYRILSHEITDVNEIKKRYLDIYGKPLEIIIKDKKGNIKPY